MKVMGRRLTLDNCHSRTAIRRFSSQLVVKLCGAPLFFQQIPVADDPHGHRQLSEPDRLEHHPGSYNYNYKKYNHVLFFGRQGSTECGSDPPVLEVSPASMV